MRLLTALKAFFAILGKKETAEQIEMILRSPKNESSAPFVDHESTKSKLKSKTTALSQVHSPQKSQRIKSEQSEAITLLATLQREARFIDFIKESLGDYSAEEIGTAALSVHDQCAEVLERFFEIRPLSDIAEGEMITVSSADSVRCLLSGKVTDTANQKGQLVHSGWIAQKCELPQWTGQKEDANILAPFEVEIQ
ncbi:MAG: DUF2760 domain-containing protein [Planctomycetia bacterium]|nr:DUF2760 domain-containing protein [Planctomycetia bacterium]